MPFSGRRPGWRRSGIALAVLAFAAGLSGCDDMASNAQANPEAHEPRPVRIMTVETAADTVTHRFSGRVKAVQTVDLSFQVGGRLIELPIKEGQVVKKGEMIARLDPADFERAVREAKVNLTLAQQDFDRAQKLVRKNVAAAKTLDQARATLDLAKVALDDARQNLAYTRLFAPFDALVSRRLVDNFTTLAAGTQVVRIQDVSEVQVDVDVPESLLAQSHEKDVADISAEFLAAPGVRFPLDFREYSSEPNAVTQTYRVTLSMPRQEQFHILPGMTASVFVSLKKDGAIGVRVPVSAVVADETKAFFVWVFDEESGTVSKRSVTLGTMDKKSVGVLSGLQPGEKIVTAGVQQIVDGMAVRSLKSL